MHGTECSACGDMRSHQSQLQSNEQQVIGHRCLILEAYIEGKCSESTDISERWGRAIILSFQLWITGLWIEIEFVVFVIVFTKKTRNRKPKTERIEQEWVKTKWLGSRDKLNYTIGATYIFFQNHCHFRSEVFPNRLVYRSMWFQAWSSTNRAKKSYQKYKLVADKF